MGEVYRAVDSRLDRTVAIKVLNSAVIANPEVKARFEREARTISQFQHPHICTLFDIGAAEVAGDSPGATKEIEFLVMEYLEGESLADRLRRGPLPLQELLKIGLQIAGALDKAHRHGFVHRDLKPGNIMLAKSGAKLLDFGLAKPLSPLAGVSPSGSAPLLSAAVALTSSSPAHSPLTAQGTIVGTVQYMSPEQIEGKEADARSDIFAFGSVLYEMATGKRAFAGKSQLTVASSILEKDPEPVSATFAAAPPALDYLIATCLAKEPDQRWQSAGDIARQLAWIAQGPATPGGPALAPHNPGERRWWLAALALLLAVSAIATWHAWQPAAKPGTIRFQIAPPETGAYGYGLALSPDGLQLCLVVDDNQASRLVIRALSSTESRVLAGTDGARFPFWSPDGGSIAFFAEGKLKKFDLASNSIQALADAPDGRGGDWGVQGDIVYTPAPGSSLYRVSAGGGQPTAIAKAEAETSPRWPHFLSDGRHFVYFQRKTQGATEEKIIVATLDSTERREIMTASSGVQTIPGYIIFVRGRTLLAQRFDQRKLRLTGDAVALADGVDPEGENGPTAYAPFTAAANGVMVYVRTANSHFQLAWFDRAGKRLQAVSPVGEYDQPALSPDGTRVVVDRWESGNHSRNVWVLDLGREAFSRLSLEVKNGTGGIWSPDGKEIAFSGLGAVRSFDMNMFHKASSGAGREEVLLDQPPGGKFPDSWSRDGRYLLYELTEQHSFGGLWVLPLTGDRKPFPYVVSSKFDVTHAAFSPDVRWVAYSSNESGRPEIFVQSFPDPRSKFQVSTEGGDQASWRADGKELFYLAPGRMLMSVRVDTRDDLKVEKPQKLFPVAIRNTGMTDARINYAASADGKRFLVNALEAGSAPATVVVNWPAELKH